MKKYSYKILICFLIYISVFCCIKVNASSAEKESSAVYIHDNANLLTKSEENLLIQRAQDRIANNNYNVLFLTYSNAEGKTTMDYSNDYMNNLFPDTENNIGFIIDMDNREIYINTMGKAIKSLNDDEIEVGLDAGYCFISNQNYYNCLDAMAAYCIPRLISNGSINMIDKISIVHSGYGIKIMLIFSIIIAAATVFILIKYIKVPIRTNKT